MLFENNLAFARRLDEEDTLHPFRDRFLIPVANGQEQIYFVGNSLGLQPVDTRRHMERVMEAWANYGVEGFFIGPDPWLQYHDKLTGTLSAIVGALPQEVTVMNQLTVNFHLMMVSFYRPLGNRFKILCEAKAFPGDQYALETHARYYGFDPEQAIVEVHPRSGEHTIREEDILAAIEQHRHELALVLWGGVNYYTGQLFNMKAITAAAHEAGAAVGFDLAHAAGNIPLHLHSWNVDFACWCSYKYLNSGPGAVGAAYVHERYHRDPSLQRFAGWWGYDRSSRFLMEKRFVPAPSAEGWQLSTPSPILYAAHLAALNLVEEAGWERVQEKRKRLTAWLWFLLDGLAAELPAGVLRFITPRAENEHGCQVSILTLRNGKKIFDGLTNAGIMVDWREPDVIRLAPVPLYNSFEEVWRFTDILQTIIKDLG